MRKTIIVIFVCLALAIIVIPVSMLYLGSNTEDPNWFDTHAVFTSIQEAVETLGSDLLIDNIASYENDDQYTFSAVLQWTPEGSLDDRSTWVSLEVIVYYKSVHDERSSVMVMIFFDDNDPDILGDDMYVGWNHIFDGSENLSSINGIDVYYVEYESQEFPFSLGARFIYMDYVYFIYSKSKADSSFPWTTLEKIINL